MKELRSERCTNEAGESKTTERLTIQQRGERALKHLGLRLEDLQGKSLVDIGAGDAPIARVARKKGIRVISVDADPKKWKMKANDDPSRAIEYVNADAKHLPFPEASFDVVVSHGGAALLAANEAELREIVHEAMRILKPGGTFRMWPHMLPRFFPEIDPSASWEDRLAQARIATRLLLERIHPTCTEVPAEGCEDQPEFPVMFVLQKKR